MSVGVSQQQMVKPVPPKRSMCKCGGGRGKVNVLIWGDLFRCVGDGAEAMALVRVVLTEQKSAEVVVPVGIMWAGKG